MSRKKKKKSRGRNLNQYGCHRDGQFKLVGCKVVLMNERTREQTNYDNLVLSNKSCLHLLCAVNFNKMPSIAVRSSLDHFDDMYQLSTTRCSNLFDESSAVNKGSTCIHDRLRQLLAACCCSLHCEVKVLQFRVSNLCEALILSFGQLILKAVHFYLRQISGKSF